MIVYHPNMMPLNLFGSLDFRVHLYHILYIIVEAKRKLIPTIKEVLTNRITVYLKFRHVSLKKAIHYMVW